jgi:hypothetical protein
LFIFAISFVVYDQVLADLFENFDTRGTIEEVPDKGWQGRVSSSIPFEAPSKCMLNGDEVFSESFIGPSSADETNRADRLLKTLVHCQVMQEDNANYNSEVLTILQHLKTARQGSSGKVLHLSVRGSSVLEQKKKFK